MPLGPFRRLAFTLATLALAGCADRTKSHVHEHAEHGKVTQGVWVNGDFEESDVGASPAGWATAKFLNPGVTDLRPQSQTIESLNLTNGGALMTAVVGGAPESQQDPDLGTNGTLRFPKYGQRAALVNYGGRTDATIGKNKNTNSLTQSMTIGVGDVDPTDDKVHVRFAVAPVLENPNHAYTEQPYYFVRLLNQTTGETLYQDFNASGQSGVPWKNFTTPGNTTGSYTDWQLVDIAPGNAKLSVGDQVEVKVVAAGCSLGGHWGRVYVDAVGSGIPGIFTWATGPQKANAGSVITYKVNYKNGATTTATGTRIDFKTPPTTTFSAVSLPGCTKPAVGATGTVSCPIGTLAQGATGSFTVSVKINNAAANGSVITNGNYSIVADGVSSLVGPKVQTTVTSNQQYANVGVTLTDGAAAVGWGQALQYQLEVRNAGPTAATVDVTDNLPAQLTNASWTCSASAGAVCTGAGVGSISDVGVTLPASGVVTYTVDAEVIAGTGTGKIVHSATATVTGGVSDPDENDNTGVDIDSIGDLRALTVNKTGFVAGGSVSSVPANIACGPGCSSASGDFLEGAQVLLTATPVSGATFVGWSGACTGTSTSCTVTMSAAQTATARFVGAPTTAVAQGGGNQNTKTSTAFASPLVVKVTDTDGNAVPNLVVTFTGPGAGASIASTVTATTDASGVASRVVTANAVPGAYNVAATVPGVAGSLAFALANVGPPASVAVTTGDSQSTIVGTAFGTALAVVVRDAANQLVSGATVSFTAPGTGASATPSSPTALTDGAGVASVTATANLVAGAFTMTASSGAANATFSLTNLPAVASQLAVTAGGGQSTVVRTAFATPIQVRVSDVHGNPIAGAPIAIAAPNAGASALPSLTATTTSASGVATFTAQANAVAGGYLVDVTSGSLATTVGLANLPGAAARIVAVSGGGQTRTVGAAFAALVARVEDADGNPIPGTPVSFGAPAASASLDAPGAIADAAGEVRVTPTAGTLAGAYEVEATSGALRAGFALTNAPGAPASLAIVSGSGQSQRVNTALAAPLTVVVRDAHANAVPGVAVTFAAPPSGASVAVPAAATTSSAGLASVTGAASTVSGAYAVRASIGGAVPPVDFALTNVPGTVTSVAIVRGAPQSTVVGLPFATPLEVVVKDAYENVVPGATVAFASNAAAGAASSTLATPSVSTDGAGRASTTATATTVAGTFGVVATAGTGSVTFGLTNRPAAPAAISAVPSSTPQTSRVRSAFATPLVATVVDAHGNAVPDVTVRFTAPATGPTSTFGSATTTTDAQGRVSTTATAGTASGTWFVTAKADGVTDPATFSLTAIPGDPTALTILSGTPQTATVDTTFAAPLEVLLADMDGNPVPGVRIDFSAPGAVVASPSVHTDAAGKARTAVKAGKTASTYQAVAVAEGAATPKTFTLTNAPGAATHIAPEATSTPQSARVTTSFAHPLAAIVTDAFGNRVPHVTVTYAAPATGPTGTLAQTSAVTGDDGRTAIAFMAGTSAGMYQVTATIDGAAASFSLSNTAGAASALVVVGGGAQIATVDTDFASPLAVLVQDEHGNSVPFVKVAFDAPGAMASLTHGSVDTDEHGHAQVGVRAGKLVGTYVVKATSGDAAAPATFALLNVHGAPSHIAALAASTPQATRVGTSFAAPLAVRVTDAFGNPAPRTLVDFAIPGGGASATLSAASASTGADGVASVLAVANMTAGTYDVMASFTAASASLSLTNTSGDPGELLLVRGHPQRGTATRPFAEAVVLRVIDGEGNPIPGTAVTLEAPEKGPSASTTSSLVSGETGEVALDLVANAELGAFTLKATVEGTRAPVAIELTIEGIPTKTTATGSLRDQTVNHAFPIDVVVGSEFATPDGPVRIELGDGTVVGRGTLQGGKVTIQANLPGPGQHSAVAVYEATGPFAESRAAAVVLSARPDSGSLSGGSSCAMGTGGASELGMFAALFVLVAALLRRRRQVAIAAGATALIAPSAAHAEGLAIDRYHAASSDSRWFGADSLSFKGNFQTSASAVVDYAALPLVSYEADGARRTELVQRALLVHAGASMTLRDRVRVGFTVPTSLYQDGERGTFNGTALGPGKAAVGDLALAADVRVFGTATGAVRGAIGVRTTLPTGSRESYMGDGVIGVAPRASVAGSIGRFEYSAYGSVLLREQIVLAGSTFGHEVRLGGGAGVRFANDRVLVGPEIITVLPVQGGTDNGHATEAWLGAHWRVVPEVEVGLGGGIGIINAIGTPDQRGLFSIAWSPRFATPARAPSAPAEPTAPPPPAAPPSIFEVQADITEVDIVVSSVAEGPLPVVTETPDALPYLYFDTDVYRITRAQEPTLKSVLARLRSNPTESLVIDGHADERGGDIHNDSLSQARARSVIAWFVAHGVARTRLESAAYGAKRPQVPQKAHRQNRRVELRVR